MKQKILYQELEVIVNGMGPLLAVKEKDAEIWERERRTLYFYDYYRLVIPIASDVLNLLKRHNEQKGMYKLFKPSGATEGMNKEHEEKEVENAHK
jgi:hypothetical protein